jgi:hypothetical protein
MKKLAVASSLAALACAAPASAAEGVKRLGVQAGFAGLSSEGSFAGFGGGLRGGYALTDAWTLAIDATVSSNQVAKKGGRSLVASQSLGALYALDILQIVPYFGAFVGVYELGGGGLPSTQLKLGGQVALGLDWVHSRELTLGLEMRAHALPVAFLTSPSNPTPFYATSMLKAEYTWGWF